MERRGFGIPKEYQTQGAARSGRFCIIAQLVELLNINQAVTGSNPVDTHIKENAKVGLRNK